jgi:hypothetical protein
LRHAALEGISSALEEILTETLEDFSIEEDIRLYYAEELDRINQLNQERPKVRFLKGLWSEVQQLWREAGDLDSPYPTGNGLSW